MEKRDFIKYRYSGVSKREGCGGFSAKRSAAPNGSEPTAARPHRRDSWLVVGTPKKMEDKDLGLSHFAPFVER